jgi:hypothetical protein
MNPSKAEQVQLFKEEISMSLRWQRHWASYKASPSRTQMRERPKFAGAVSSFLLEEFETHPGLKALGPDSELQYPMALALLSKAIPLSKTHDEDFVLSSFALMAVGKTNTRLPGKVALFLHRPTQKLSTKAQRIALVAFPFFALPDLYLLWRDSNHYGWEPSFFFVALFVPSAACLAFALTKVGAWVQGK